MLNKHSILISLFVLVLVVLISGCINQAVQCPVVVSQTEGIAILDVRPSYNEIPVNSQVSLQVDIQNMGTSDAENINATLWSHAGFVIGRDIYKDGKSWVNPEDSTDVEADNIQTAMSPPNLDVCSAGDAQTITWDLQAGCDPRETTLAISIDYDYTSSGWASIFLVSADEAHKTGGIFKEKGQNIPSAGPIQVKIEPLQTEPVILSEGASGFDVRIKFKNLGTGLASAKDANGTDASGALKKVTVTVQGPCVFTYNPNPDNLQDGYTPAVTDGEKAYLVWEAGTGQVALNAKKQEAIKVANLEITDFTNFIKDFCTITAVVDYHYRIVESTSGKMGISGSAQQVEACRIAYSGSTDTETS